MKKINLLLQFLFFVSALFISFSCSSEKDEPSNEEKIECTVIFRYDMNMLGVSSFPEDATTISVWAFNSAGKLAGAYHCSAKDIQADDASVTMNLPSGSYDFIAWCGLKADAPLALGSENPSSKEDLSISLKLKEGSKDAKMFDSSLPSIYHGMASSIRIVKSTSDTQKNIVNISLIKDTKKLRVVVQGLEGKALNTEDLDFRIENGNNLISWDNIAESNEKFYYAPYDITSGKLNGFQDDKNNQELSVVNADFILFPFLASQDARLVISNKANGNEMINISVVEYILTSKQFEAESWSDQEYLDRQDSYRVLFYAQ